MWPWSCAEQPLLLTVDHDTSPKVKITEVPIMLHGDFNFLLPQACVYGEFAG